MGHQRRPPPHSGVWAPGRAARPGQPGLRGSPPPVQPRVPAVSFLLRGSGRCGQTPSPARGSAQAGIPGPGQPVPLPAADREEPGYHPRRFHPARGTPRPPPPIRVLPGPGAHPWPAHAASQPALSPGPLLLEGYTASASPVPTRRTPRAPRRPPSPWTTRPGHAPREQRECPVWLPEERGKVPAPAPQPLPSAWASCVRTCSPPCGFTSSLLLALRRQTALALGHSVVAPGTRPKQHATLAPRLPIADTDSELPMGRILLHNGVAAVGFIPPSTLCAMRAVPVIPDWLLVVSSLCTGMRMCTGPRAQQGVATARREIGDHCSRTRSTVGNHEVTGRAHCPKANQQHTDDCQCSRDRCHALPPLEELIRMIAEREREVKRPSREPGMGQATSFQGAPPSRKGLRFPGSGIPPCRASPLTPAPPAAPSRWPPGGPRPPASGSSR